VRTSRRDINDENKISALRDMIANQTMKDERMREVSECEA